MGWCFRRFPCTGEENSISVLSEEYYALRREWKEFVEDFFVMFWAVFFVTAVSGAMLYAAF